MNEEELQEVISEAYERGGEADTVLLCKLCKAVCAGALDGSIWCCKCGEKQA